MHRPRWSLLLALLAWPPFVAHAQPVDPSADPTLGALVAEVLANSPEYARAKAAVEAERQRIPQVGALPDPTLSLGIQNDGFRSIQIGTMETSYWQVMITQPLFWPGKRGLREDVARAQSSVAQAQLERIRLTRTAEAERAYVDLLLVRGQLDILAELETLWKEAEAIARARYEVGAVTQSDLVRAQLERTRLAQQRVALEAQQRTSLQAVNRLRVHPLDEPFETPRRLFSVTDPALLPLDSAIADAESRSPDLAQARSALQAAEQRVALARRERYPDFSVSAGIMPRGGFDPMWTASIGISLPVYAGRKQNRAVDESVSRRDGEAQGTEAVRQVLRLRAADRFAALQSALRTLAIYRETLLVQSETAVSSTLAQYRVGKVPFTSVLEVMRDLINDRGAYLDTIALAQRIAIAQREVSLDPTPLVGGGAGGMSTASVPGASGGMGASSGGAATASAPAQSAPSGGGGAATSAGM